MRNGIWQKLYNINFLAVDEIYFIGFSDCWIKFYQCLNHFSNKKIELNSISKTNYFTYLLVLWQNDCRKNVLCLLSK